MESQSGLRDGFCNAYHIQNSIVLPDEPPMGFRTICVYQCPQSEQGPTKSNPMAYMMFRVLDDCVQIRAIAVMGDKRAFMFGDLLLAVAIITMRNVCEGSEIHFDYLPSSVPNPDYYKQEFAGVDCGVNCMHAHFSKFPQTSKITFGEDTIKKIQDPSAQMNFTAKPPV